MNFRLFLPGFVFLVYGFIVYLVKRRVFLQSESKFSWSIFATLSIIFGLLYIQFFVFESNLVNKYLSGFEFYAVLFLIPFWAILQNSFRRVSQLGLLLFFVQFGNYSLIGTNLFSWELMLLLAHWIVPFSSLVATYLIYVSIKNNKNLLHQKLDSSITNLAKIYVLAGLFQLIVAMLIFFNIIPLKSAYPIFLD